MNAQQVPQCKQRRVTYLLSTIYYVRNPAWIETTVCLYLLYICHTVIRRQLQNVVYMKKNRCSKKKEKRGGNIGSCPHVPVIRPVCNWEICVYLHILEAMICGIIDPIFFVFVFLKVSWSFYKQTMTCFSREKT